MSVRHAARWFGKPRPVVGSEPFSPDQLQRALKHALTEQALADNTAEAIQTLGVLTVRDRMAHAIEAELRRKFRLHRITLTLAIDARNGVYVCQVDECWCGDYPYGEFAATVQAKRS